MRLFADSDSGDIGLTLGGNAITRIYIITSIVDSTIDFVTGVNTPLETYFAGYAGTYSTDGTTTFGISTSSGITTATANSITIGGIPEPASTPMAFGLGIGLFVLLRARKSR